MLGKLFTMSMVSSCAAAIDNQDLFRTHDTKLQVATEIRLFVIRQNKYGDLVDEGSC